ncbi:MAG: hypothetical protein Q8O38_13730 [Sulfurimicrobium sp.]|nr:hypothetical protein [Sulfurimicrobium sp.]
MSVPDAKRLWELEAENMLLPSSRAQQEMLLSSGGSKWMDSSHKAIK